MSSKTLAVTHANDPDEHYLYTTLGLLSRIQLGVILPHEHIFVDLRTPDKPGYAEADEAEVVAVMAPKIEELKDRGITALVECSTTGVGRRADFDLAVSRATNFPVVVPAGSYREPWIIPFVRGADDDALEAWMYRELTERFDEADYRAGWIELSAGDDGITSLEELILRAVARAAVRTGAVIGSHTVRGRVAMRQLDLLEEEFCTADRFIWLHTPAHDASSGARAPAGVNRPNSMAELHLGDLLCPSSGVRCVCHNCAAMLKVSIVEHLDGQRWR